MDNTSIDFLSPVTGRFMLALVAAVLLAYAAVWLGSGRSNRLSRRWPIYVFRGILLLGLLALLFNPVRVTEQAGSIQPAEVFLLLDASASMAIGNEEETRWHQAVRLIRNATASAAQSAAAELSLFRFGRRLRAVASPDALNLKDVSANDGYGVTFAQKDDAKQQESAEVEQTTADEPDTQLFVALRQISSRFGRKPPSAVVVFSDGRARDAGQAEQVAASFSTLGVPVHVVPVGDTESGGDVALVSLVMPNSARKQSEVEAQAFIRSYGFDGTRVELELNSLDRAGRRAKRLATVPLTLKSGFQSVPITFRTVADTQRLECVVPAQNNEVSADNNRFEAEMMISREKIRVLYIEGNRMRSIPTTQNGRVVFRGPTSTLQTALQEDVDIECRPVQISVARLSLASTQLDSFPKSVAELSAFDAIILSDVPRRTFTAKQLDWIEGWVRRRGGGLCMVGGRNSFAAGQWKGSALEKVLPVKLADRFDWRGDLQIELQPIISGRLHPLFVLSSDGELNRNLLANFPRFLGANVGLLPKRDLSRVVAVSQSGLAARPTSSPLVANADVRGALARNNTSSQQVDNTPAEMAGITVGQYGRGRTMAIATPITGSGAEQFLAWGRNGRNQYYSQFWRNLVYWLTEQSYIGRRRLVAAADKRYYGPGDTIILTGSAFDESANETSTYRLVGVIEPQSFDNIDSDYSVVRWPNNLPREEASESPFIIWGEEFEIPIRKIGSREAYQIELALAETLSAGLANQSLRLELTAYEDYTQVDSTSVPIQILHDPFEQQNPFPNHELLSTLAERSGGQVLKDEQAVADMLASLPISRGPSERRKTPIWSAWWVMILLLGVITLEWCYRRWIGLA